LKTAPQTGYSKEFKASLYYAYLMFIGGNSYLKSVLAAQRVRVIAANLLKPALARWRTAPTIGATTWVSTKKTH